MALSLISINEPRTPRAAVFFCIIRGVAMSLGELIFLCLVLAAFAIFGIALAVGSAYERAGAKRNNPKSPPGGA